MSMHLIRGLSSTPRRKSQNKLTARRRSELEVLWKDHNKFLASIGQSKVTFEQFVDHMQGRSPKFKPEFAATLKPATSKPATSKPATSKVDHTDYSASCARKEAPKYTGGNLIGIAVLHKSCLQPVFTHEQAIDISQMRRN